MPHFSVSLTYKYKPFGKCLGTEEGKGLLIVATAMAKS